MAVGFGFFSVIAHICNSLDSHTDVYWDLLNILSRARFAPSCVVTDAERDGVCGGGNSVA